MLQQTRSRAELKDKLKKIFTREDFEKALNNMGDGNMSREQLFKHMMEGMGSKRNEMNAIKRPLRNQLGVKQSETVVQAST